MSYGFLKALLEEKRRRDAEVCPTPVRELLFKEQIEVLDHENRSKALICGRGSGKSSVSAAKAVEVIQKRDAPMILLASLTREQAYRTLFKPLSEMAEGVGIVLPDPDQQGRVKLPDGGILYLSGVDTRKELRKYRGTPWDFALVDEAGEIPDDYLYELVYDVIEPRLMDKPWSELWVSGTPGHALSGTWFDITGPEDRGGGNQPGWAVFHWDARSNPYVDAEAYFAHILKSRGWDEEHTTFVREYKGLWVTDALRVVVSRGIPGSSLLREPRVDISSWRRVLSLDFGLVDECAGVLTAFSNKDTRPIVLRSWSEAGLSPTEASARIAKEIHDHRVDYAIGDSGGIGAAYIAEYARRQQLPIAPAQKDDKKGNLRLFSDDISRRYDFLAAEAAGFVDELKRIIWNEKRTDVQPGQRDHQFHAGYYGWRYVYPMLAPLKKAAPVKAPTAYELLERDYAKQRARGGKARRRRAGQWR